MSDRLCLDCGEKLKGRSDKKFCSDSCRNNYNNRMNRDVNSFVRNVHSVLRKNRKILAELYDTGKKRIHIDALIVTGYNFNFITQLVEPEAGKASRFCFEYGYRELDDNYIELVKNTTLTS